MIGLIDLRSDTVTKPTSEMLEAMFNAEVGDDVFGEDPTINALEQKGALLFEKEAGLFCPSGTMTNQAAIRVHVKPGDEVICDQSSHIYNYEGGGIAANAGASVKVIHSNRGKMTPEDVLDCINPDDYHCPVSRLVSLENTSNKGGGSCYTLNEMLDISKIVKDNGLAFHLDGARIFNALVELEEEPSSLGKIFDSISICLSKGLGSPMGSLLLGSGAFINEARRVRKLMGGGMRQAGYMAAAGIYALDNHIHRLKEDHRRAKEISDVIMGLSYVENLAPVDTNIVIFKLNSKVNADAFLQYLEDKQILAISLGPQMVRMVTHLDIMDEMVHKIVEALKNAP